MYGLPPNMKSSSHKTWQTSLLFLKPLQIQNLKRKKWGGHGILSPSRLKKWGTRPPCPPPNCAHDWKCSNPNCNGNRRDKVALRTTCIKNVKFKIIETRTVCQYAGDFDYSENQTRTIAKTKLLPAQRRLTVFAYFCLLICGRNANIMEWIYMKISRNIVSGPKSNYQIWEESSLSSASRNHLTNFCRSFVHYACCAPR